MYEIRALRFGDAFWGFVGFSFVMREVYHMIAPAG